MGIFCQDMLQFHVQHNIPLLDLGSLGPSWLFTTEYDMAEDTSVGSFDIQIHHQDRIMYTCVSIAKLFWDAWNRSLDPGPSLLQIQNLV